MEQSLSAEFDIRHAAKKLEPLIRRKWQEVYPALPLIQPESVINKIIKIDQTANQIKHKQITTKKRNNFLDNIDKLFDILFCRCPFVDCSPEECDSVSCDIPHMKCDCLRVNKIPVIELAFIKDQRNKSGLNGGKMVMKGVDLKTAQQQENTMKKKEGVAKQLTNHVVEVNNNRGRRGRHQDEPVVEAGDECPGQNTAVDDDPDQDFIVEREKKDTTTTDIKIFVAEFVRYQVSDRAAVALYSAALKTLGPAEKIRLLIKVNIEEKRPSLEQDKSPEKG